MQLQDGTSKPVLGPVGLTVVHFGGRRWWLATGRQLTFGRASDRDIRFARDPEDDFVSRRAGVLVGMTDGVLVRNESGTQSLLLQAFPGPETVIPPGAAMATLPHDFVRLVVPGRHGARYSMTIDTRPIRADADAAGGSGAAPCPASPIGRRTRTQVGKLSDREMRLLAALCEPLMTLSGPAAAAASYRQIAVRTGSTRATVKTCLDALRMRLSDADGIPGLRGGDRVEDQEDSVGWSYLPALAAWAVNSRVVTLASLDLLASPPR